jgi:hypothetical protein
MKRFWILLLVAVSMFMVPQMASADQESAQEARDAYDYSRGEMLYYQGDMLDSLGDAIDSMGDCTSFNKAGLSTAEKAQYNADMDEAIALMEETEEYYEDVADQYYTDSLVSAGDGLWYWTHSFWDDAEEAYYDASYHCDSAAYEYECARQGYDQAEEDFAAIYAWLQTL